jgi:hypothetical protein
MVHYGGRRGCECMESVIFYHHTYCLLHCLCDGVKRHFQQYFSYIVEASVIDGGSVMIKNDRFYCVFKMKGASNSTFLHYCFCLFVIRMSNTEKHTSNFFLWNTNVYLNLVLSKHTGSMQPWAPRTSIKTEIEKVLPVSIIRLIRNVVLHVLVCE